MTALELTADEDAREEEEEEAIVSTASFASWEVGSGVVTSMTV